MLKTSTTFPLPQNNTFGVRVETNIPKKLESNNYAGTLRWKVFIASQGHWKWSDNIWKREVCNESMTKFSYIQFFYETRLCCGNAIVKMLYSTSKKIIRHSRMLVHKKASDFVLSFCPKIFAGRQGCIAKKEVWARRFHTKHKGRLIRLQEFPHWIFLFHFCATVLYTR